jgi:hypothetical protein
MTEAAKRRAFVAGVKLECKRLGVRFVQGKGKTVWCGGSRVSGYFDETSKVLAFAGKRKDWIEILSHESCHMDQWSEQAKVWTSLGDASYAFDQWLEGTDLPKRVSRKHAMAVLRMELDCEQRAVRKLIASGVKFDRKRYVQKANAYLFLYHWLLETRRWPNKKSPYSDPVIVNRCSSRFHRNYDKPPKGLMQLYNKRRGKMLTGVSGATAG